eukprot:g8231.t1
MMNPKIVLPQNDEENKQHAETILKCCGPAIHQILQLYDEQARILGTSLEKIGVYNCPGFAFTCDRCSTAIADFHFGCPSCTTENDDGKEVCVSCVAESRTLLDQQILKRLMTCNTCSSSLVPKRLIPNSMLRALRQIAEMYGNCENQSILPVFGPPKEYVICNLVVEELVSLDLSIEVEMEDQAAPLSYVRSLEERLLETNGIEWRDAGHGSSIRVIDFLQCNFKDLQQVLELSICKGEPFIIKNVHGVMDWRPATMIRAFVEKDGYIKMRRKLKDEEEFLDPHEVCVIQCKKDWPMYYWKQREFFQKYNCNSSNTMYKIKDWPPDDAFSEKLPRHNQDFIEMLPCPHYTNPISGVLNLTRALPESCCRPDIGPKTYIATGRSCEKGDGTDSVTKLHLDMSDAINIVLHSHKKPEEDTNGAAVWYVIARRDIAEVKQFLGDVDVFSKKDTYLEAAQRDELAEKGVQIWSFSQNDNEAVYVPSGCPHQVRNTRSCLKVAVDFFPPQSAPVVMGLTEHLRQFSIRHKGDEELCAVDTLQGHATILHASYEAFEILKQHKKNFSVLVEEPNTPRKPKKQKLK